MTQPNMFDAYEKHQTHGQLWHLKLVDLTLLYAII